MTMFSMKPKFDLAEFLAEPPKAGAARKTSRGMQYRAPAKQKAEPEAEVEPKPKTPKAS